MGDKRILIGNNGSEYGLWVSKTGTDVTTAGDHDLLFDSSRAEASLIIKSGAATGNTWYSWGSTLNYIPLILHLHILLCLPVLLKHEDEN